MISTKQAIAWMRPCIRSITSTWSGPAYDTQHSPYKQPYVVREPKKQLEIDLHLGAEKSGKCADRTETAMALVNAVIRIMVNMVTKETFISKTPPKRLCWKLAYVKFWLRKRRHCK